MSNINNTVCMLNIGLNVTDAEGNVVDTWRAHVVLDALKGVGVLNLQTVQHTSRTEPTLVIRCVAPTDNAVYALAYALEQDCIAVWNVEAQTGSLIGPKPEAWGEFDPAQFILLDGSLLSDNLGED